MRINERIRIDDSEFGWSFVRSAGPGGQNVNKVASKAVLRWQLTDSPGVPEAVKARLLAALASRLTRGGELVISSQRFRDQERNRRDCLEKLEAILQRAATPPRPRKKSKPTRGSQERRLAAKRVRSAAKQSRRTKVDE